MTGRMDMSGEAQGCWKRDGRSLAVRANKRNGKEANALEKKKNEHKLAVCTGSVGQWHPGLHQQ